MPTQIAQAVQKRQTRSLSGLSCVEAQFLTYFHGVFRVPACHCRKDILRDRVRVREDVPFDHGHRRDPGHTA